MKYFYAAATMGFGPMYWWHRLFSFPDFPIVTKIVTLNKKQGYPFAILPLGHSTWNHIGLHNPGLNAWLKKIP